MPDKWQHHKKTTPKAGFAFKNNSVRPVLPLNADGTHRTTLKKKYRKWTNPSACQPKGTCAQAMVLTGPTMLLSTCARRVVVLSLMPNLEIKTYKTMLIKYTSVSCKIRSCDWWAGCACRLAIVSKQGIDFARRRQRMPASAFYKSCEAWLGLVHAPHLAGLCCPTQ